MNSRKKNDRVYAFTGTRSITFAISLLDCLYHNLLFQTKRRTQILSWLLALYGSFAHTSSAHVRLCIDLAANDHGCVQCALHRAVSICLLSVKNGKCAGRKEGSVCVGACVHHAHSVDSARRWCWQCTFCHGIARVMEPAPSCTRSQMRPVLHGWPHCHWLLPVTNEDL